MSSFWIVVDKTDMQSVATKARAYEDFDIPCRLVHVGSVSAIAGDPTKCIINLAAGVSPSAIIKFFTDSDDAAADSDYFQQNAIAIDPSQVIGIYNPVADSFVKKAWLDHATRNGAGANQPVSDTGLASPRLQRSVSFVGDIPEGIQICQCADYTEEDFEVSKAGHKLGHVHTTYPHIRSSAIGDVGTTGEV